MTEPSERVECFTCVNCEYSNTDRFKFCPNCGSRYDPDAIVTIKTDLRRFYIAFGIVALYILGSYYVEIEGGYVVSLVWDSIFFLLVTAISVFFWRVLKPVFSTSGFSLIRLLKYGLIQLVLTILVFVVHHFTVETFGLNSYNIYASYLDSPFPFVTGILSVAIFPAVSEEIAFRGVLFGQLNQLTGSVSTVVVTGLLFALVHFSFLSFLWLIPAGFYLGWIRWKTGSIWICMWCHFQHNFSALTIDFFLFQ